MGRGKKPILLPALETGRRTGMNIHLCSQLLPSAMLLKQIMQCSSIWSSLVCTLGWGMISKLQWERSWVLLMPCGSPFPTILASKTQKALFCSKEAGQIFEKGKFKPTVLVLVPCTAHNAGLCADSKEKNICACLNGNWKKCPVNWPGAGTFRDQFPECSGIRAVRRWFKSTRRANHSERVSPWTDGL